jgi:predicted DNA-binding protein
LKLSKYARTVRFEPEHYARLEKLALDQGKSMAELVRTAIVGFLDGQPKLSASERRHLRVTEYMQVALDAIIRENHPELRETLVLETDRRMKLHHGA